MTRAAAVAAGWVAAIAACSLTPVEPIPLVGPPPRRVWIAPVRLAGEVTAREIGESIAATLPAELRRRGYETVPVAAGVAALRRHGLDEHGPPSLKICAAVARELGADAMLSVRVERWDAVRVPGLVAFAHDIGYRLWRVGGEDPGGDAGDDGRLQWELRSRDFWRWDEEPTRPADPDAGLDSYLGQSDRRSGSPPERGDRELARGVHRRVLARLPAGPR